MELLPKLFPSTCMHWGPTSAKNFPDTGKPHENAYPHTVYDLISSTPLCS